jgi:predicted Zn-dependent protease
MAGDHTTAEEHLNTCLRLEHGATDETQLEFLLMRAQTGEADEVGGLLYDYVLGRHPDAALILETVASAYMHDLRYGPAYYWLNQWVAAFPDSARPYHFRGWVLERMAQPGEALEDYLRALDRDPNLDPVRLRVAEMYLEDKDPLQALPHLEYLLARDPGRPEAQARLGQCRYLRGEPADARRLLEAAASRLPGDSSVLLYLARLDLDDGQPVPAEGRLRRAMALEPSDIESRFTLITALRMQHRDAEADAELAEYSRQKADLERANHLLQEEAKKSTRDPQAAFEIGELLLRIHRDPQAIHWLSEALARDPTYPPAHRLLAEYFEAHGEPERAAVHRNFLK